MSQKGAFMDRRQQKTRRAIFEAFSCLLSKKSYTRITVQDIIDQANIGRSTFYSHFETKDDLVKEMCTDIFQHVFSEHLDSENTHDFSLEEGNPDVMITHILYHLQDNKKDITAILSCESGALFLHFFKQFLNELIVKHILNKPEQRLNDIPEAFLINHISGSFIEMVKWWIIQGMKQTPEELAQWFGKVIWPVL